MVDFYGINLGKYTNRPMDPVGLPLDKNSSRPSKNPDRLVGRIPEPIVKVMALSIP